MEIAPRDIIFILAQVGALAVTIGIFKNKVEVLERKVSNMDDDGTAFAREHAARVDQSVIYHERRLTLLEAQNNRTLELLSNLNTKVEVVVAWVDEQKKQP